VQLVRRLQLIPPVSLALFAGLRPEAEIFASDHPLDWHHIDFETGLIDIDRSKNTGSHRYVTIQPNLKAWLEPYAQKTGAICSVDYYGRLRQARSRAIETLLKAGKSAENLQTWPADVLRHSYASYHAAAFNDSRLTSAQMGHSGDLQIFNRHYRNRVKPLEASAFWTISPVAA
jgi:integrase